MKSLIDWITGRPSLTRLQRYCYSLELDDAPNIVARELSGGKSRDGLLGLYFSLVALRRGASFCRAALNIPHEVGQVDPNVAIFESTMLLLDRTFNPIYKETLSALGAELGTALSREISAEIESARDMACLIMEKHWNVKGLRALAARRIYRVFGEECDFCARFADWMASSAGQQYPSPVCRNGAGINQMQVLCAWYAGFDFPIAIDLVKRIAHVIYR